MTRVPEPPVAPMTAGPGVDQAPAGGRVLKQSRSVRVKTTEVASREWWYRLDRGSRSRSHRGSVLSSGWAPAIASSSSSRVGVAAGTLRRSVRCLRPPSKSCLPDFSGVRALGQARCRWRLTRMEQVRRRESRRGGSYPSAVRRPFVPSSSSSRPPSTLCEWSRCHHHGRAPLPRCSLGRRLLRPAERLWRSSRAARIAVGCFESPRDIVDAAERPTATTATAATTRTTKKRLSTTRSVALYRGSDTPGMLHLRVNPVSLQSGVERERRMLAGTFLEAT